MNIRLYKIAMSNRFQFNLIYMVIFILFLLPGKFASAQSETRVNTSNFNAWVVYNGQHFITGKLGLHAEVQIRRNNGFNQWQQLLLRPGVFYKINKNLLATAGYAYVETYPYGDIPIAKVAFPEHRVWQQVQLTQPTGAVDIVNRLRLEERFFGDASVGTFTNVRYENRFRYMLRAAIPLTKNADKATRLYLPVYDEVFIAFGKNVKYNTFDQNRFGAGLGWDAGKLGKVEVGYLYQYVQQRNLTANLQQVVENNHSLSVTFYSVLPFRNAK